uniref:Tetratricopeptide repeat protein 7 N-terminal domain-containing protein n=1 Tax=Trichuris muris TaxID=70415 RepID=A0A5S6QG23_TRIMR
MSQSDTIASGLLTVSSVPFGDIVNQPAAKTTVFVPANRFEEMYVLACISEAIVEQEIAHNDSEDKHEALVTLQSLHNLVTHLLAYLRQFHLLSDVLCTAVSHSQEDRHLWLQYALNFVCNEQNRMAASAFRVLFSLAPENSNDAAAYLFAGRLYLEKFDACDMAVRLGLALSRMADLLPLSADRAVDGRSALSVLHEAVELDVNDYLAEFYLALERSWQLCPDQPNTTFLLALLLTARKLPEEALELVEEAVAEHPSHSALLLLRLRLYSKLFHHEYVITAAKELLVIWRTTGGFLSNLANPFDTTEWRNVAKNGSTSERQSRGVPSQKGAPSSNGRTSIVATNHEYCDADSLVLSSIGSMASHQSSSQMNFHFSELNNCSMTMEARLRGESSIWLELAETLLELGMSDEVAKCVDEASKVLSQAAHILYLKARLYHQSGCLKEAATCYEVTLSACPHYASPARHLALIRQSEGNFKLAEKLLRDVVRIEPLSLNNWVMLGELLSARGASSEAADCFSTAVALADISPLVPFYVIPRVMSSR